MNYLTLTESNIIDYYAEAIDSILPLNCLLVTNENDKTCILKVDKMAFIILNEVDFLTKAKRGTIIELPKDVVEAIFKVVSETQTKIEIDKLTDCK